MNYIRKGIEDLMLKQWELNDVMLEGWRKKLKPINFQAAIMVEAGEALDSACYKWWKKCEYDKDNIVVELIDVLHFKLGELYYLSEKERNSQLENFVYGAQVKVNQDEITLLTELGRKQGLFELAKCFTFYKVDFDNIYKTYIAKYTLNKFRIKNGYKDGTYIKNWNGEEDNYWVMLMKDKYNATYDFSAELYKEIDDFYKNNVLEQNKGENNDRKENKE